MSVLPVIWAMRGPFTGAARTVLSAALPNLTLALLLAANVVWMTHWEVSLLMARWGFPQALWGWGMRPESAPGWGWMIHGPGNDARAVQFWWETAFTLAFVILIDFAGVYFFSRRWRARRWGRKPRETEVATRYFIG